MQNHSSAPWNWLKPLVVLLGILLLSYTVFVFELDGTSLWADEGWTIAASSEDNPLAVIDHWVEEDVHPPLYFLVLQVWRQPTGDTIFAMRYLAVLISLMGVALIYRLGRDMFSVRAGMVAAVFFGLHDLVNVLTQEVRHYSLQQTMTILAIWLYWRFWQRPASRRGLAFAIGGALLLWTHYWGGFVLLALGLHALVTRWRQWRPYVLANLAIGILYIPWLPIVYGQITQERPEGLPHALENSWHVYKTLAFQLVGIPEILWLVLAGVGIAGAFQAAPGRRWWPTSASILPAMVVVITVGLSLVINTRYETLSFRSLAVVIPSLALLVGHALAAFRDRELGVMVAFLLLHSLATTSAGPVERPPWPEVADYLARHTTSADTILLEVDSDDHALAYYLDQTEAALDYRYTETTRATNPDDFPAYLDDILADRTGIWLVKFGFFFEDIRPQLEGRGFVRTAAPITRWGPYADGRPIELWRYDRPAENPEVTFGDTLALMRYATTRHPGVMTVNLLWSPLEVPQREYFVSVFLLQPGQPLAAQHDSPPLDGHSPTLAWNAGDFYFDSHALDITNVPPGRYFVGVKVYYFLDPGYAQLEILPASDCSANEDCEFIFIDEVEIR
ncbi:MAG: hypothetical protein GYB66_10545 [Chloroflexi bacterium]|nr:hypothetical protein [Chloroflexota bacterium]